MSVLDLFDLRGRRALVTGASTGIGKQVAQAYLQAGARVAIAARDFEALQRGRAHRRRYRRCGRDPLRRDPTR
jgi:NAD(P)-dependent dehydrogenase (short-subunit alcohol dehydrogenase family)